MQQMNAFAATMGDQTAVQPFATLLCLDTVTLCWPVHVAKWSAHSAAMCSRAWHAQVPRFAP